MHLYLTFSSFLKSAFHFASNSELQCITEPLYPFAISRNIVLVNSCSIYKVVAGFSRFFHVF